MVFPWYVLPPHQLPSARAKPHALGGPYADGLRERNGDSGGNLYGEGGTASGRGRDFAGPMFPPAANRPRCPEPSAFIVPNPRGGPQYLDNARPVVSKCRAH